jgi:hypothetical protein
MVNRLGALHADTEPPCVARTRQWKDAGAPVDQGSEIGTDAAGIVRFLLDQISPFPAVKPLLVESSKS